MSEIAWQQEQLIIVGSGPAAHTAAIYAARARLNPLLFEGFSRGGVPGGQLMITTEVENFPGFPDGITGPELMARCRAQSLRFGTRMVSEDVDEIDVRQTPFRVRSGKRHYQCQALILAMGARARFLGLENEKRLLNAGVSACATCDGALPMFRQQVVACIGGGDSAMEEALFLSRFAAKVLLVHRRREFRASAIMLERVQKNANITLMVPYEPVDILGGEVVEAIALRHRETGIVHHEKVAGVFVAIGHTPNTEVVIGDLDKDELGYLKTHHGTHTNISGVFACGDIQDHTYRQAITAAGSGCQAAIDVERFLSEAVGTSG